MAKFFTNFRVAEKRVKKRFEDYEMLMTDAMAVASLNLAHDIMKASRPYVPVDTGRLRASGFVGKPRKTQKGWQTNFGYQVPYAAAVHSRVPYLNLAIQDVMNAGGHVRKFQATMSSRHARATARPTEVWVG